MTNILKILFPSENKGGGAGRAPLGSATVHKMPTKNGFVTLHSMARGAYQHKTQKNTSVLTKKYAQQANSSKTDACVDDNIRECV